MNKNHPRARHSWIEIEVQIGPSVIKQWAFPLGHVGTAATRLCGWSPRQRCEMEIRLEAKHRSKRVPRKAVTQLLHLPEHQPLQNTHTVHASLLRNTYTIGQTGWRGMIQIPTKLGLTTKPSLSKRRLRVLMWALLPNSRCSSPSFVTCACVSVGSGPNHLKL